ncbi:response regulator [Paenibacillus sp. D51F]
MLQLLLVDDEPYAVDDLSIALPWLELGFDPVHKAYSGQEALAILDLHPIDIVVTDINMPAMSGLQLLEQIRMRWKRIKCVLLTGHADFDYAKEAVRQQASRYLLKPVADAQLIDVLRQLALEIQREWEALSSYQQSVKTLQEHLPLLRDRLLNDILQGNRRLSQARLSELMLTYRLPLKIGDPMALLIVRPEEYFQRHDQKSLDLFEYAIVNIADELFAEHFHLWSCKDSYDYLVFLLMPKSGADAASSSRRLEQTAYHLQQKVNSVIGGGISVVTSGWGPFPGRARSLYQLSIARIRQQIGPETGVFLSGEEPPPASEVQMLQSLYEPPTLFHLFETSSWDAIEEKIRAVFHELKQSTDHSTEHIQEARHYLEAAFYHVAHRNNKRLGDILGQPFHDQKTFHTPERLLDWGIRALQQIKLHFDSQRKDLRSEMIRSVHEYIEQNLHYISLPSIAEHVGLHPVYLSKIYKSETGQKISDYIFSCKMERAAYLLSHSPLKIYEISSMLGYSNAHYFIKLFKESNGMTPQEFRDRGR